MVKVSLLAFLFAIGHFGNVARAADKPDPEALGTYQNWAAYSLAETKGRTCFVYGQAMQSEPAKVKREAHILVTHRPAEKAVDVVTVEPGYVFATDDPTAEFAVDKDIFKLLPDRQTAWTEGPEVDKAAVAAMIKGRQLVTKSKSAKGLATTDIYSLAGFRDAMTAIDRACKVAR